MMRNTLATSTSIGAAKTMPTTAQATTRPSVRLHAAAPRNQWGGAVIRWCSAIGRGLGIAFLWVALAAAAIPAAFFCAAWIVGNAALRAIEPKMLSTVKSR